MKKILVKLVKIVLVFLMSTLVVYSGLVYQNLQQIEEEYQLSAEPQNLDAEKVKDLGDTVQDFADMLEEEADKSPYKDDGLEHTIDDGHDHSIGEFYDSLGISTMSVLRSVILNLLDSYDLLFSECIGVAIAIAYAVITSKKLKTMLKILIGYCCLMIVFPPLYMYSWTYRFWKPTDMYCNSDSIRFYIIFTIVVAVMFVVNFVHEKSIADGLNKESTDTKK